MNPINITIPGTIPKYDSAIFDVSKFDVLKYEWWLAKGYFDTTARGKIVYFRITENSNTCVLFNDGVIAFVSTGRIL